LELYKETIKLFAEDYPELYTMILDDLGISPFEEFNGINLNLIMELYGFFALFALPSGRCMREQIMTIPASRR
jgi:hypothetical protein